MTLVKMETLRELTRDELQQRRAELADEQFNLRMRQSLKALDNPLRLRHIRREIAKIITLLREDDLDIRKLAKTKTTVLGDQAPMKKTKKK